jgi:Fur family transcriptional regulator, ferric uptake regulator
MAHKHKHATLEAAFTQMKSAKLKRTKPREAILQYLVENHGPFSAKELQQALKRKEFDAVTTYRCLASFEEAGLVRRCDFGDGIARFEIRQEDDHHHHHVICMSCRKIEKLEDCHLDELEEKVKKLGYAKVRHVLEFSGLCRECQKKSA